jgi:hypothetical protein
MNMYGVSKCFGEAVASYFAHAIIHGISNNRFKRLDLTATRDLLRYAPQDDAFEIFQADLQEWLDG